MTPNQRNRVLMCIKAVRAIQDRPQIAAWERWAASELNEPGTNLAARVAMRAAVAASQRAKKEGRTKDSALAWAAANAANAANAAAWAAKVAAARAANAHPNKIPFAQIAMEILTAF